MGLLRLSICISGVYATFLLWAIAQERLSKPFPSVHDQAYRPSHSRDPGGDKLPSTLFLNFAQAAASATFAAVYLTIGSWRNGNMRTKGIRGVLGLDLLLGASVKPEQNGKEGHPVSNGTNGKINGAVNGTDHHSGSNGTNHKGISGTRRQDDVPPIASWTKTLPFLLFQVSLFQTMAGPIGFSALRHISYPTMVLGKSCKLIPVLLLNVLLYRRRFSPHKYLVVSLVTVGISMFMFFGPAKKKGGSDSAWGLMLLLINLLIDGLTNSTQDQIFTKYPRFTGQQMMFMMSSFTILLLLPAMVLPLPDHPMSLVHHLPYPLATRLLPFAPAPTVSLAPPAVLSTASFIMSHPSSLAPLLAYALLGGLGQLFIFETIQHFGSLTLVMVTVTRKLFTMLLSVIVFNHSLTAGQWLGVAVVFSGIAVEAGFKRIEMLKRAKKD